MTVFELNCTVGPGGLCQMLLVFGEITCNERKTTAAKKLQLEVSIDANIKEVEMVHVRRRIEIGLQPKRPKKVEDTSKFHEYPVGYPVLEYRLQYLNCTGPF